MLVLAAVDVIAVVVIAVDVYVLAVVVVRVHAAVAGVPAVASLFLVLLML